MVKLDYLGYKKDNRTFLTEKYREVYVLILFSTLVVYINSYTDMIITGCFLSSSDLAALSVCHPAYQIVTIFGVLFSSGTLEYFGKEILNGNRNGAGKIFNNGMTIALLGGIAVFIVMLLIENPFLAYFGIESGILEAAKQYYTFLLPVCVLKPICLLLSGIVILEGRFMLSAVGNLLQIGINILFSLLLLQPYGIAGVAAGTTISLLFFLIFTTAVYFRKEENYHYRPVLKRNLTEHSFSDTTLDVMPYIYEMLIMIILDKVVVSSFGEDKLVVVTMIETIYGIFVFFEATLSSMKPLLGTYFMEANREKGVRVVNAGLSTAIITAVIVIIIMFAVPDPILSVFDLNTPSMLHSGRLSLRLVSLVLLVNGIGSVAAEFYFYVEFHKTGLGIQFSVQFILPLLMIIAFGITDHFIAAIIIFFLAAVLIRLFWKFFIKRLCGGGFAFNLEEDDGADIHNYDIRLTTENIMTLRSDIENTARTYDIPEKTIHQLMFIVEEICMLIKEKNGEKPICLECVLKIFPSKKISLIIRDNGIVFDITDADMNISSLRSYIVSGVVNNLSHKRYFTALNYNRNGFSFSWNGESITREYQG